MDPFFEMMRKVQSTHYFDQMRRFAMPLSDHFGVNHFWYYKISNAGSYAYMGTHASWSEFCFGNQLVNHFPCLRHPKALRSGISLMRAEGNEKFAQVQQAAWDRFRIHFILNLFEKSDDGIEAFGFGARFNDPIAEERLLNELPLLRYFIKVFREKHSKLFQILGENQVDLSSHMGTCFYEKPKQIFLPSDRDLFLKKLGCESFFLLSSREKEILKYLANGYPASFIKDELHLGVRTIENYLVAIKIKLSCNSKVELIHKAKEIAATGFFDPHFNSDGYY